MRKFRIVSLPPFKASSSGIDQNFDFSPEGVLGKFNMYFSSIVPSARDSFSPRDFLSYDEANRKLYEEAFKYIDESEISELDIRPNHYAMGHIITPSEIIKVQGWAQMETFIPIKLKSK